MNRADLELYSDFLLSACGDATATGLSAMVNGEKSHDQITRFLSKEDYTSVDLWREVKATVRRIENNSGVLIFDDTIQEKEWTDESDLMCWHYDHCSGRHVKGINLLNALYHCNGTSIPVAFELVKKPIVYCDIKTRKGTRKSDLTKNEMMRQMIDTCLRNGLKFKFILMDSWFSSVENFAFITQRDRHFIAAIKSNRLVALSEEDRIAKRFVPVDSLDFSEHTAVQGWLNEYAKAVRLVRQVFTNKDGSIGILYLACSELTCTYDDITTTYKKRWKVEEYHKSMKSNANLARSPTQTIRTQSNHVFMAIYATFKLECLSIKNKLNPFALCRKLLIHASRSAYAELRKLEATA